MTGSGHREIDHTADLGFALWADSLPDLYAEAAAALAEVCYDRSAVAATSQRSLEAAGDDRETLLVRWLQEVYLLLESELWLVAAVTRVELDDDGLRAVVVGEPFDADRHTLHTEIKAITYHGLAVEKHDTQWRATVVVDV